jgi:hypothetical protein
MRGLTDARAEIGIATMAYNLKRITNVLGAAKLTQELLHARWNGRTIYKSMNIRSIRR